MPAKVFVSCGQATTDETRIAKRVCKVLEEFGLSPYLAFTVQSLDDIMAITNELRSSDYYLFIDFLRKANDRRSAKKHIPISIFTHQELALAHHLGFKDLIAFQQEGIPLEGFLKYVHSNPEPFKNGADLIIRVRQLVKEKGWTPNFSRNLVVREVGFSDPLQYTDHTGTSIEKIWYLKVENRRPDAAAVGTVCILDHVEKIDGTPIPLVDRSYLKWAGQAGYERTILPTDYGVIDLFAIRADAPGVFLHSLRDTPREPILEENGEYTLFFKLFSSTFPLVEFAVRLVLRWEPPTAVTWPFESTAFPNPSVSGSQFIGEPDRDTLTAIVGRPGIRTTTLISGSKTSGSIFGTSQAQDSKDSPQGFSLREAPQENPEKTVEMPQPPSVEIPEPAEHLTFDEETAKHLSGNTTD